MPEQSNYLPIVCEYIKQLVILIVFMKLFIDASEILLFWDRRQTFHYGI